MIVIDPGHLIGVDFNFSAVTAVARTQNDGVRLGYPDRGRPDHGLCLVTEGSIVYTSGDGKSLCASRGDVVYLPRGKRYVAVFEGHDGGTVSDVLINFILTDDCGRELSLSDDIFRPIEDADEEMVDLFWRVAAGCSGGSVMETKMLMFRLMSRLTVAEKGGDRPLSVPECVTYIDVHCAEIQSVAELAALCGLGETAFRRRFREHMGMSPVHYINAIKVERACRMLHSSEISVIDVCRLLNFYDVAYFHKVFKRYTGKTPGEYGSSYTAVSRR